MHLTATTSKTACLTLMAVVTLLLVAPLAMALEEPEFEVIAEYDGVEIRRYAPYLVAEFDAASGNRGFRTLAGYIFGDNDDGEKMAMTAPVETRPSTEDGLDTYAFVMEKKYTKESLPRPNDERIRVLERPARVVAARRYSGRWTEASFRRQLATLRDTLAQHDIEIIGPAELARYNGPFTLPFLRRNEVIVPVRWPDTP